MVGMKVKGLSAVLGLLAFAQPALADTSTLPSPTYTPGSPFTGTIKVTASVGGVCGFSAAPNDTYTINDIDSTTWSKRTNFTIECNVASHVAVISDNGGLKNAGAAVTGYTNLSPYSVRLNLVGANAASAQADCMAATLKTGTATCSYYGQATTGNSSIGLGMPQPSQGLTGSYIETSGVPNPAAPAVLIAGNYNDILRVSIAATP